MTLHLTLRPASHQGDVGQTDSPRLVYADKIAAAYERAFTAYEAELRSEGQRLDQLGLGSMLAGYPSVDAVLYEEEGEQSIVFDFDLLALLIESFVLDGWSGIERLQSAVYARAPDGAAREFGQSPSGGVPDDPQKLWVIARRFFELTRNLVGMLAHESLVAIELKAARVVESRLDSGLAAIGAARTGSLRQSEWSKHHGYFELHDRDLARQLYKDMTKLVYELAQVQRLADARDAMRKNQPPPEPAGSRGAEGGSGQTDATKSAEELRDANTDVAQAEKAVAAARRIVHTASPLALLALAKIEEGFTAAEMEQAIDVGLSEREKKCLELKEAVSSGESRVATHWPRPTLDDAASADQLKAIAQWTIPYGGHLVVAANKVLAAMGSDAGWLPLAREDVLHELVASEAIDPETFEYPVYFHYVSAWMSVIEKELELEKKVTGFLTGLGHVTALASLVATRSPTIAGFIQSRIVNGLLLGVMAYTFFKGLSVLDDAIQAELIGSDHLSAEKLASSAKLEAEQDEYIRDFAKRLLLDTLLIKGAQRSVNVRHLILSRNYYEDARTLLSAPSDG